MKNKAAFSRRELADAMIQNIEPIIRYRFSDDPKDMIREHIVKYVWKPEYEAYEIMPPFPGK